MAAPGYGQFGTPGFFQQDIPSNIVANYPGTLNIRQGGSMYGNLAYGPYSRAYQVASAQADDPAALAFQQQGAAGGGAFANPGEASVGLGNLFKGLQTGQVAGQTSKMGQQAQAIKGLLDTSQAYGSDIYGTQSAALQLQQAQAAQQAEQFQQMMRLGILAAELATGNYGAAAGTGLQFIDPGAGGGAAGTGNPFQPQQGSLWSSTFGSGGGPGGPGTGMFSSAAGAPSVGANMSAADQYALASRLGLL